MARMIEEMGVGFTLWTSDFPFVFCVQTSSRGYTASYLLFISLRLKRPGHKTEHIQPPRGRIYGAASTHSKVYLVWCIMQLYLRLGQKYV
jgi:hypothetical protein